MRVLPVEGPVLNLGALSQPGVVGSGCMHLYRLWGGAAAASPAWQHGALSALLAALEMLWCYFPWKMHFCGILGSMSASVKEI